MTKLTKILAMLLLAASCCFAAAWTGSTSEPGNVRKIEGKGFYVITSADELAWFAEQVNGGRSDINAVLANDIVFGSSEKNTSTVSWTPIGKDVTHPFAGTLDGAGYTIYGLYVSDATFAGLVGVLSESGILKNIKKLSGHIFLKGPSKYVGSMVAVNNGVVLNVENRDSVKIDLGRDGVGGKELYVGGLVGFNAGYVLSSGNKGKVYSRAGFQSYIKYAYSGGIAGYNIGFVSGANNFGYLSSHTSYAGDSTFAYSGGIVGYNENMIETSRNEGGVDSQAYGSDVDKTGAAVIVYSVAYSGGIAGYNVGEISRCDNNGKTYSEALSDATSGKFFYYALNNPPIDYVPGSSLTTAKAFAYNGGIVGYNGGKFSDCRNSTLTGYAIVKPSACYYIQKLDGGYECREAKNVSNTYNGEIVGFNKGSIKNSFSISYFRYMLNNSEVKSTSENMQRDQFAWMLNTSNGTEENSGVWTRGTEGYPTFANADSLPIYRVVFNDEGITSNRYTNYQGFVVFPEDPEPADGSIFSGWFNSEDVKVKPSTMFVMDQTINAVYTDASDVFWNINFYNADSTLLNSQTLQHGSIVDYHGETPSIPATAKYTYIFAGWNVEPTNATENFDYYAVYDSVMNSYKVVFQDYDKKELKSLTYEYGATPRFSEKLTRASSVEWNYSHVGWDPAITAVTEETVYTAVYDSSKVEYTVTFMNGTEVLETLKVPYGSAATPSVTPTRVGYKFIGWSPKFGNITADLTVKAMFEELVYRTVSIKEENGEIIDNVDVEENGKFTLPSAAEKTGYKFDGWYDSKGNCLGQPGDVITISADISIEARYSILSYTITFVDEDGSVIESGSVEFGSMPTASKEPTKAATAQYTYEFAGWTPEFVAVSGDAIYTATYNSSVRNYVVTFADENGKALSSSSVAYGKMPTVPATEPTKAATAQYNYTFAGWSPELVKVTDDATYKATFTSTLRNYSITFVDEDGTEISKSTVAYGKTPSTPADPSKASTAQYSYEFAGWSPAVTAVSDNAIYTATYTSKVRTYEIVFIDEDGTEISRSTVAYGKTPSTPADPSKASTAQYTYEFAGWTPEIAAVKGKTTYMATYNSVVRRYTITFVDEDGTEISKSTIAYGKMPTTPDDPEKTATAQYSYEFAGWTPELVKVTGEATYKASYNSVLNVYKVTFLDYDGFILKSQNVKYGTAATAPAEPERDGYKFTGWDKSFDEIVKNTDVTAQYEKLSSSSVPKSSSSSSSVPKSSESQNSNSSSSRNDVKPESSSAGNQPASSSSVKHESSSSEKGDAVIEMVAAPHFSVEIVGRNIQISAARIGSAYMVLDMQGRVLKQGRVNVDNFNIAAPRAGNYLIRIGNQTRNIVVH